jgi:hypothetical protein
MAPEGIPLWDTVTHPFANVLDFAFGCRHRKLSRVFTLDGHTYKVCCECGTHFEYSLQTMSLVPHHTSCSRFLGDCAPGASIADEASGA